MHSAFEFLILFAVILAAAKIFGEIALKCGQSAIIGELIGGVIIGPSVLGLIPFIPEFSGIAELGHIFTTDPHSESYLTQIVFSNIAELGAVILLFEAGLSTDIKEFAKAGGWATAVAFLGVFFPFLFGFFIFRIFNLDINNAIFAGAVLTATSVGITARVFLDLNKLDTEEAKIVLGAAVIDDVIGLTILAVVSKLVTGGSVTLGSILQISGIAVIFLVVVVAVGLLIVPFVLKHADKMKQDLILFLTAVIICLLVSALSLKVGLAPIVGAFAIGLVMSNTKHVGDIKKGIKPIYALLVPVFFVLMGSKVDITIFNPFAPGNAGILALGGILFVAAFIGKVAAGFAVFKKGIDKLLIGTAMVPRGEVGLIFASMGLTMGVFAQNIYSALVVVIMLTTFVTPILLKILISRKK